MWWGVSGTAESHHHIPGPRKILQLLDEDAFIADVVGIRHDGGPGIGKRHDAKARGPVVAGAFGHFHGEVRRGSGAASVPANEDLAPFRARLNEDPNGFG